MLNLFFYTLMLYQSYPEYIIKHETLILEVSCFFIFSKRIGQSLVREAFK